MAGLQCLTGDGAIIIFGGTPPGPFIPPPTPTAAGDQPAAERAQGYPQMRGLLVIVEGNIQTQMGVSVDELTQ